ncbi:MAG: PAS domain S-box protein [Solirubrobacterales bacterium]
MAIPLKILIVEDQADDATLILYEIRRGGYEPEWTRVCSAKTLRKVLESDSWDIVTCDYSMPAFNGAEALWQVRSTRPDLPVIIVSGEIEIQIAVALMKSGARDYVHKSDLVRLPLVIERELREAALGRKRAAMEQALRESEEKNRKFFENAPLGLFHFDTQGRITACNDVFVKIIGSSREQLIGLDMTVLPDQNVVSALADALSGLEGTYEDIYHSVTAAKTTPVRLKMVPVLDAFGAISGGVGIIEDVTEAHEAREKLVGQLEFVQNLIDTMPNPVFYIDAEQRYMGCNRAYELLMGKTDEQLIGRTVFEVWPEAIAAQYAQKDEELLANGLVQEYEITVESPSGARHHVVLHKAAIVDQSGVIHGLLGVITDISRHKQMEKALALRETQYWQLLDTMSDLVWEMDANGVFVFANRRAYEVFGLTAQELVGRSRSEVVAAWQPYDQVNGRPGRFDKGIPYHQMLEIITRLDGREIILESNAIPIFDENGGFAGYRGVSRDVTERIRAIEALEQSEAKLRLLFDTIATGVVYLGADGRILDCNAAAEAIIGLTRHEMLGLSWEAWSWEVIREDGSRLPKDELPVVAALRTGKPVSAVIGVRSPIRHEHQWLRVYAYPLVFPDEARPCWIYTSFEDITEFRSMETALRETGSYLEKLLQYVSTPIVVWNPAYRITRFNRALERLTGFKADEVVDQPISVLFPEAYREQVIAALQPTAAGEQWESIEIPVWHKNGSVRIALWNSANVYADDGVTLIATIAQGIDITERKRMEAALAEREEKYRSLYQDASLGIFHTSFDGRFMDMNPALARMLGFDSPEEAVASISNIAEQLYTDPARRGQVINDALQHGEMMVIENRFRRITGEERDTTLYLRAVRDRHGNPVCMQGFVEDITERKRHQEEIRRLNENLERRVEDRTAELNAFVHSVSHDLRAPIRVMREFSNILLAEYGDRFEGEVRELLEKIAGAARLQQALMDALMQLSRIASAELQYQTIDISRLAREVVAALQDRDPDRRVAVRIQQGIMVNADSRLMRVVVENLLDNAWKYTGQIPDGMITFGAESIDGETVCFVSDNGAGFDQNYAERLFQVFQRLHTDEEFSGNGVGLSVVHRIIERHGGRVWGQGQIDQGATFYFTLPKGTVWDQA